MTTRSLLTPDLPSTPLSSPVLAKGFRPFFLLGAAYAVLALPLWLLALNGYLVPSDYLAAMFWHAHEMVFGFSIAIVAGFLLTAIGNWTERRTAEGPLLGLLCVLWLLGRVAMFAAGSLPRFVPMILDLAFLPALIAVCARPIIATKNRRNYIFLAMLTLLWLSNLSVHLGVLGVLPGFERLGNLIGVDLLCIALVVMAGRVIPMFTRNATRVQSIRSNPMLDRLAVGGVISIVFADAFQIPAIITAILAGLTGALVLIRMYHWGTRHTLRQPLLWILHIGSIWIGLGLILRFLSQLTPAIPFGASLHALTAGALGCLTLGMMTRVGLGHTGRMLAIPTHMTISFMFIVLAGLLRVVGPYITASPNVLLAISGTLWSLAFTIYLATYTKPLMSPRVDKRPG